MSEQRDELDGRFCQTVDRLLLMGGVGGSRQKVGTLQVPQPICQNVGGDPLVGKAQKISVVAAISENDVADDDQAPGVTEQFEGQIDRAAGAPSFSHSFCRYSKQTTTCILQ